ncbi:metalloproteinase inhibitor 2-like isoform X2 [Corythoichthys intestinalis]|uniref:metalloproteinase inhibitor 2-like isoform X2 n=1 Tax=Corythoichthys intestinalis TaxID=161448 RepID=UPI0025A5AA86|nr:metalloproteinase inhibitor 2-like isoform X2 [Corythoichthys intestinalis]
MKGLVLTLLLLPLLGLQEGARACSCIPMHPQQMFCQAHFAIRATVVGKTGVTTGRNITDFVVNKIKYDVKLIKDWDGFLQVDQCGFVRPWSDLSAMQRKGLSQTYKTGCNCKITRCTSIPCGSGFSECLWPDSLMFQNFACVEKNDGSCAWFSGLA